MRKIVLVLDWMPDDQHWLPDALRERGASVAVVTPRIRRVRLGAGRNHGVFWAVIKSTLAWRAFRLASHANAAIIANSTPAILAALIPARRARRPRRIVGENLIMAAPQGSVRSSLLHVLRQRSLRGSRARGIIRSAIQLALYRRAFRNPLLTCTVNGEEIADEYAEWFHCPRERCIVLTESWPPEAEGLLRLPSPEDGAYVFVGGEADRDWDAAICVAKACPTIPFQFIARRRTWPASAAVPANVVVRYDTTHDEFLARLGNARVVLLPLRSDMPAGLIVLKEAILLGRLVIAMSTPAVRPYFPPDCRSLLLPRGDTEGFVRTLMAYWNEEHMRCDAAARVQTHVVEAHGPVTYTARLIDLAYPPASAAMQAGTIAPA